jgi:hypothetical protein
MKAYEKVLYNKDLRNLINTYIHCKTCKRQLRFNRWAEICVICAQKERKRAFEEYYMGMLL